METIAKAMPVTYYWWIMSILLLGGPVKSVEYPHFCLLVRLQEDYLSFQKLTFLFQEFSQCDLTLMIEWKS